MDRDQHTAWWQANPSNLRRLKERHRKIVEFVWGLGDQTPHTYAATGRHFGISRTRVTSIIQAAPAKSGITEAESAAEYQRQEERLVELDRHGVRLIEELDLDRRCYNCLKRANIDTVRQLVGKSIADLKEIRSLGKHSIDRIIEVLASENLTLRQA